MVLFGAVFGLGEGGDGEEELQQHGDRKDEIEEGLKDRENARDPEAAATGEDELRKETIEDKDQEDEFDGGANDFAGAGCAGE
jgi:hypothetical protein